MVKNLNAIAIKLGAVVVGQVPEAGGGAFGAAKIAKDVSQLRAGSQPIRVTTATLEKLERIAERASATGSKIAPLEIAARLLEEAVAAAEG